MSREEFHGAAGCGVAVALVTSIFGGDTAMQLAFFAFGFTYGGLWIKSAAPLNIHEETK